MSEEHGRHETFSWPVYEPSWAVQLTHMVRRVLQNQEIQMALTDDLRNQITALQNEDGVIITALNDLLAKAQQGGSVSDTDVQAAIDSIKSELSRVDSVVQTNDPGAEPTPPATQ